MIPYGKHYLTSEDVQAVVDVLGSDHLTQGPRVREFEERFAEKIGAKHAVAVANGTAALHLGALALGVKPGDKVITTPVTFAATANCIQYCGGVPVFADVDPHTGLLDLEAVEELLNSDLEGVVGIIPVDLGGYPVDMEAFRKLADQHGLWLMEDACHAPGGSFVDSKGRTIGCGSGTYEDLAIFSFHPVKHIAAGEGGMVTTHDGELAHRIRLLRAHGVTKDPEALEHHDGGWYYEMQELGFNYRMSDIHAALGTSQLDRLEENLFERRRIASRYDEAFASSSVIDPVIPSDPSSHAYHLYIVHTPGRKELYDHLRENGILAQVHYIPLFKMPYYKGLVDDVSGSREGGNAYYKTCLSLPIYPSLEKEEQDRVIRVVQEWERKRG